MSTSGTEKHCRLCLMLSKGGTKACHNLLIKRVEELKPRDTQPNEWTLKTFLESKKQIIIKSKLSKEKWKVLFPKTGDTVLSNWDLSLFCQVLSSYCGLTGIDLLDIKQLRTIRNDLCHMNDAEITNTEFKNKIEMIQVIIGRILEKLDDKDLKLEVDNIIKNLESGPLSLDETLKEMRKFYLMEMEVLEKLDHVEEILLEKFEKLDDKCELINNKLDQRGSSGIDSARNNVLVPGVNIFLDLKNVSNDEEAHMSDVLQQLFEEVMNQDNDFKSSIPLNSYGRLRAAVNKTFQLFLSKGWRIISALHECIQLHIRCSNFKSLAALFREHINGQINTNLSDLNEALIELVSGGKPCFQTTIYRDEFWNVLDKSISSVDRFLSELNIDNVQPLNEGRRFTLSFSARNAKSESSESFYEYCNNELHTCLQLLKTELESEFSTPHLSIQASCSTNVNREKDDTFTDDEEENLNGQGDIMQPIKTGDVKISKLCKEEKEISYSVKDEKEKCHKTAIKRRFLEDIDSTKGAQEKEKYHTEKEKIITEQDDWHDQTIFSPANTSTYSKEESTAFISKYCTEGKEISYRIKDEEEKGYKTAIKRPFVEDTDSTKGAQEKEKYHKEKKKKITEQGDWHAQRIFSPASTSTYSKEDSTASIPNNAGGYVFKLDDRKRLRRFLIIGSDRTYYAIKKELEIENKNTIKRLIRENNGAEVVKTIKEISKSRRNVRQDALLFAFAVCARSNDTSTKRAAYAALSDVCRIPTHLFMFINYCEEVSSEEPSDTTEEREAGTTGWGRAHKRAIQSWYTKFEQNPEILARLIRKYGKGYKWKHKDAIRLCHAKTDDNVMKFIFSYIIKGYQKSMTEFRQIISEASDEEKAKLEKIRDLIKVYDDASRCQNVQQLCQMIREHKLAWEHCNQTLIKIRDVWHNLLPYMPIEALVRNLSRMTKYGLLTENSEDEQMVLDKIRTINIPCDPNSSQELHGGPLSVDEEMEDEHPWGMGMRYKNYLHPLKLLTAWQAYKTGHSEIHDSQWTPNQKVVDALEEAFYKAYSVIERTNKTFYLAVNTSVSTKTCMYDSSITHSMAAAAMLMLFARTEDNCIIKSFGGERVEDLGILRTDKLEHVVQKIRNASHPRVNDCAQPIKDAIEMKNTNIDVFVYYTDSETCGGNVHPYEALIKYREHSGNSEVRLVVCAMNATDLTLSDQEDPLVLDIVGVDANAPWIISEFAKGHI